MQFVLLFDFLINKNKKVKDMRNLLVALAGFAAHAQAYNVQFNRELCETNARGHAYTYIEEAG